MTLSLPFIFSICCITLVFSLACYYVAMFLSQISLNIIPPEEAVLSMKHVEDLLFTEDKLYRLFSIIESTKHQCNMFLFVPYRLVSICDQCFFKRIWILNFYILY